MVLWALAEPPVVDASYGLFSLFSTFEPFFRTVSWILGGAVGIYLILLTIRVYNERLKVQILKDIRYDLDQLNIHFGVRHSVHRPHFFKKFFHGLFRLFSGKRGGR